MDEEENNERPKESESMKLDVETKEPKKKKLQSIEKFMPSKKSKKNDKGGGGFFSRILKIKKTSSAELISKREKHIVLFGRTIKFKKRTFLILLFNTLLSMGILLINFMMLRDAPTVFSTINILALFVFAFPVIIIRYNEYKKTQEVEDMFPIFLRDFVETTKGGMTIPHAMKSLTRNDYKALNPYVKQMAAQLNWGIPVQTVLMKFAKKTDSTLIMRVVSSVIESHKFGGNLSDTFEALSGTAVEIDRLREERKLYMNSQIMTGYIVFFVFLGVMIGLQKFLVPSLSEVSAGGVFGSETAPAEETPDLAQEYQVIFKNLILIQGLFAGLSVGKMSEGSMVSGTKHSLFMMFVGFLVFTVAS